MSGLQKQIADLNRKVEQLHKAVERLSQQISLLAPGEDGSIEIEVIETVIASESIHDVSCPSVLSDRDILLAETHRHKSQKNYYGDGNIPTDIQIRRLTAQLTAAYSRIATLEEQLLSHRIHSQV
jgi:predicted  nucleic acid-binding Zn-ribbon protein